MAEAPYTAQDVWPDPDGSLGDGPQYLQGDGDVLLYASTFRNDSDLKRGTLAKILDGLQYLYNRSSQGIMSLGTGKHYGLSSRSVTRSVSGPMELGSAGTVAHGVLTIPNGDTGTQGLELPHGATITRITYGVKPVNATPPASPVQGRFRKVAIATGAVTTIDTTTDSTSGAAYGVAHTFQSAVLTEVVDRTLYTYHAQLLGETGGGAAAADWNGTLWTGTVTGIDEGAA